MKKLLIGLFILVLVMVGFIWKSNSDRDARQEALAIQTEQHNKEMAKLDSENKDKQLSKSEVVVKETNIQDSNTQQKHKYSDSEWMSICKSISSTARTIMNRRQNGASMSEMMDGIMATDTAAEFKELIKPFVISAYENPRFSTPENMLKAEIDFENEAYLKCMNVRK
ncbi:hypothetical protein [Acinetobacter sp. SEK570]|uniref:hypothetical protein n=1 Tax=unclassified Acinetobacter TaxID=196816 RepID=UPI00399FF765